MKHTESDLQKACVKYFRLKYPKSLIFAVPNGGFRNVKEAARMKSEGVLPGVSDLVIMWERGLCRAWMRASWISEIWFIELKSPKGKQTENQKEFEKFCEANGYYYSVVRSFDEFKNLVD